MAKWRRRVFRGLALAMVGGAGVGSAGWSIRRPARAARPGRKSSPQLRQRFTGAESGARFGPSCASLGGITFNNLTLYRPRRSEPRRPFLHVPRPGVIYHDKGTAWPGGGSSSAKIKFRAFPRLDCCHAEWMGRWKYGRQFSAPCGPTCRYRCSRFQKGTVRRSDHGRRPGRTAESSQHHVEIHNVDGSLLNHPLALLNIDLHGEVRSWGPARGPRLVAPNDGEPRGRPLDLAAGGAGRRPWWRETSRPLFPAPGPTPIVSMAGAGRFSRRFAIPARFQFRVAPQAPGPKLRDVAPDAPVPADARRTGSISTARCIDGDITIDLAGPPRGRPQRNITATGAKSQENSTAPATAPWARLDSNRSKRP